MPARLILRVICVQALAIAERRLRPFKPRVTLVQREFSTLPDVMDDAGVCICGGIQCSFRMHHTGCACSGFPRADGILLDLGMLRAHAETPSRGFSYRLDGRLDMRYDAHDTGLSKADELVNSCTRLQLCQVCQRVRVHTPRVLHVLIPFHF